MKTREDWEIRQGYQYFLPEYTIHTYILIYLYHNYFAKLFGEKLSVFLCSESSNSTFLAAAIFEDSFQNILSGYTYTAKLLGLGRVPFLGAWMESWARIFTPVQIFLWISYKHELHTMGPYQVLPRLGLGTVWVQTQPSPTSYLVVCLFCRWWQKMYCLIFCHIWTYFALTPKCLLFIYHNI